MKKYVIEIKEVLFYSVEVEADSVEDAKEQAYSSEVFSQNMFYDNDSEITLIQEKINFPNTTAFCLKRITEEEL